MKGLVCGDKERCSVCQRKNVFEEKEDACKIPDFKAASDETAKTYTFIYIGKEVRLGFWCELCGCLYKKSEKFFFVGT
jgi:hypothetical protein